VAVDPVGAAGVPGPARGSSGGSERDDRPPRKRRKSPPPKTDEVTLSSTARALADALEAGLKSAEGQDDSTSNR
jgi:hypothetical protein